MNEVKENKRTFVTTQIDVPLQTLRMTEKCTPLYCRLLELRVTFCLNQ